MTLAPSLLPTHSPWLGFGKCRWLLSPRKMLEATKCSKMSWLPALCKLLKARLAQERCWGRANLPYDQQASRASSPGGKEYWRVTCLHPAPLTPVLEFCLCWLGKQEHLYLMHGSWTRIIGFKGNYTEVVLHLWITIIHTTIFCVCI